VDLTYAHQHLGDGPAALRALLDGTHPFMDVLKAAKHPMVILGRGALARPDGLHVLAAAWQVAAATNALRTDWHGFNLLHLFGGQAGALELGFLPGPGGKALGAMLGGGVDVLWLLGADGFDPAAIGAESFVIYQGHHGDRAASRADVILPGAAYTEKDATYVNTEGRAQRAWLAVHAPGEAREDWRIVRAAAELLGVRLPFDTLDQLRARMAQATPQVAEGFAPRGCEDTAGPAGNPAAMSDAPFAPAITQYHLADAIARASDVMAECARTYGEAPALAAE
jgi:NADH-quinone oxidoreductase subunit G